MTPRHSPPNIVLMVADDLGYGDVGCYGSQKIPTPHIDRLAVEGLRATDAHATAAVCTPTRYSILTGRNYVRYRRKWVGNLLIESNRPTLASVLHENGYATGYFGKWHLGWGDHNDREHRADIDWNSELPAGVLECGFDTYFGTPFSHNEPPFIFVHDRKVVGLEKDDPLVITPKFIDRGPWGHGYSTGAKKAHEMRKKERIDLIVTQKTQEWIEQNRDRPFFVNVAFVAPHVPIAPDVDFVGKTNIGSYGDFVYQMDWCVGQIVETLKKCGVLDDTLIIFTSDNGAVMRREVLAEEHYSNGALLGQKTDAWEGGQRVPFIVRWPGHVPAGSVTDRLISLSDIPATVWAAAGIPALQGTAEDSINQLAVLKNLDAPGVRSEMLVLGIGGAALRSGDWVYHPRQGSSGKTTAEKGPWVGIREQGRVNSDYDENNRLKPGAPETQLYNLRNDISQTINIVREHAEKAKQLDKRYNELMQELRSSKMMD